MSEQNPFSNLLAQAMPQQQGGVNPLANPAGGVSPFPGALSGVDPRLMAQARASTNEGSKDIYVQSGLPTPGAALLGAGAGVGSSYLLDKFVDRTNNHQKIIRTAQKLDKLPGCWLNQQMDGKVIPKLPQDNKWVQLMRNQTVPENASRFLINDHIVNEVLDQQKGLPKEMVDRLKSSIPDVKQTILNRKDARVLQLTEAMKQGGNEKLQRELLEATDDLARYKKSLMPGVIQNADEYTEAIKRLRRSYADSGEQLRLLAQNGRVNPPFQRLPQSVQKQLLGVKSLEEAHDIIGKAALNADQKAGAVRFLNKVDDATEKAAFQTIHQKFDSGSAWSKFAKSTNKRLKGSMSRVRGIEKFFMPMYADQQALTANLRKANVGFTGRMFASVTNYIRRIFGGETATSMMGMGKNLTSGMRGRMLGAVAGGLFTFGSALTEAFKGDTLGEKIKLFFHQFLGWSLAGFIGYEVAIKAMNSSGIMKLLPKVMLRPFLGKFSIGGALVFGAAMLLPVHKIGEWISHKIFGKPKLVAQQEEKERRDEFMKQHGIPLTHPAMEMPPNMTLQHPPVYQDMFRRQPMPASVLPPMPQPSLNPNIQRMMPAESLASTMPLPITPSAIPAAPQSISGISPTEISTALSPALMAESEKAAKATQQAFNLIQKNVPAELQKQEMDEINNIIRQYGDGADFNLNMH